VRFLGRQDHFACLRHQSEADVLVNIGNAQSFQIPGKVYEYLGAARPILHIAGGPDDPGARVIVDAGAGIVVDNSAEAIAAGLRQLRDLWSQGKLGQTPRAGADEIAAHSWTERARRLHGLLSGMRRT
jgi:hypothetical protein